MAFEELVLIWLAIIIVLLYAMYVYWAADRRLSELEEKKKNATIKK